jgi:hypothetical protein
MNSDRPIAARLVRDSGTTQRTRSDMSTNTGGLTATDISLTYDETADQWRARDETRGVTVRASTREAALDALDEVVASEDKTDPDMEVGADDPFFTAPTFSSGRSDISRNLDEYLAEDTSLDSPDSEEDC